MTRGALSSFLSDLSDAESAYLGGTVLALLVVCGAHRAPNLSLSLSFFHTAIESSVRNTHRRVLYVWTVAGVILLMRKCNSRSQQRGYAIGPAHAEEYEMLQVIVVAHDQEAELEVQTDAWSSYEELRELVVDAVPNMFRDSTRLRLTPTLFYF